MFTHKGMTIGTWTTYGWQVEVNNGVNKTTKKHLRFKELTIA
jgi:hypothetical protein